MSYKELKSFQQAAVIYDFTVEFVKCYIDPKSRTTDQMTQAARSGKQNIAEGSANQTSEKSELKLLGVARASLAELLEDYEDFLRQRNLQQWDKDDPRALEIRRLVYRSDPPSLKLWRAGRSDKSNRINKSDKTDRSDRINKSDKTYTTYNTYKTYLSDPEKAANFAICLINQTCFLLDKQIKSAEKEYSIKGDYGDKLKMNLKQHWLNKRKEEDEWLKSFLPKKEE